MASLYGNQLSSVGKANLNFKSDNLALISVDNAEYPALITQYSVSQNERVQMVECFNDTIHIYSFGKRPVQVSLQGVLLIKDDDPQNIKTMVKKYKQSYRAYNSNENPITITMAHDTYKGIATDFTYSATSESPAIYQFSMTFIGLESGDTII